MLFKPWKIKFIAEHPDIELQTRRVIRSLSENPDDFLFQQIITPVTGKYQGRSIAQFQIVSLHEPLDILVPYQVGEVVYIKEAWRYIKDFEGGGIPRLGITFGKAVEWKLDNPNQDGKWLSPLFMPEWAARYFLQITKVQAGRVQEITEEDAKAEGAITCEHQAYTDHRHHFMVLWNSINPKYPWESNPWVWVYTLKQ